MNLVLGQFNIKLIGEYCKDVYPLDNIVYSPNTPHASTLFKLIVCNFLKFKKNYEIPKLIFTKISVIHLRNEEDYLYHMSSKLKVPEIKVKESHEYKYKQSVLKFIDKDSEILILTYLTINNPIIEWLKEQGYNIHLIKKRFSNKRELCAVEDLIASKQCNNTFIGAFNPSNLTGSTFSYFIYCFLQKENVKCIGIDPENLTSEPVLVE